MRYLSDSVASAAYRVSRKLVKVKCDSCGVEIIADYKTRYDDYRRYYEVTTGHRDWGNDSIDSVSTKDICPACLSGYIMKFLDEHMNSDTAYCNIESAVAWPETENRVVDKLPDEAVLIEEDHDAW